MKVGIVGTGSVGQAIAKGLVRSKHEVRFGSRNPSAAKVPPGTTVGTVREAGDWAEVVILAVPYSAMKATAVAVGPALVKGKVLVDAMNAPARSADPAVGSTASAAEELATFLPGARIVKAFNTVFAQNMTTGKIGTESLTLFVAGDDRGAKEAVMRLGRDIGFDAVDAGPLRAARYLEPMAAQLINMAYTMRMGPAMGLRLVRAR